MSHNQYYNTIMDHYGKVWPHRGNDQWHAPVVYKPPETNDPLKTDEEIETERKQFIVRGLSGIQNIGNTCYMNSVLQCLCSLDLLRSWLTSHKFYERLHRNKINELSDIKRKELNISEYEKVKVRTADVEDACEDSVVFRLAELFVRMWKDNCTVTPKSFKRVVGEISPTFRGFNQNDSHELLNLILDRIHEETKAKVKLIFPHVPEGVSEFITTKNKSVKIMQDESMPDEERDSAHQYWRQYKRTHVKEYAIHSAFAYWKHYVTDAHSIITDLFTGLFYSKITCCECQMVSGTFEPFTILSVPTKIDGETTLDECIREFSKEETLTGDNKYFCEECNKKVDVKKQMYIWEPPAILIIQLKRFKHDRYISTKTSSKIVFSIEDLDISNYMSEYYKLDIGKYALHAISEHRGSCNCGHYVAYCKNSINNKWYEFNDDDVIHVPNDDIAKEIITKNAYLLFYVRK